ncbi:MAG: exo-alpha-sialidase [Bacteroidales bacterium]|nr:exo-alpha-sialidase [Bacteroidales bacterium]
MNSNHSLLQNLKSFLVLILIPSIAFLLNHADRNRISSRVSYESFLHTTAGQLMKECRTKGLSRPDLPEQASLQEYFMTMDPSLGRVPSERLLPAFNKLKEKQVKSSSYQLQWDGKSVVMGGRTRAIMWDPNDATGKKVWAGSVTGGLWYNPDITSEISLWQPVSDMWPNMVISCITSDPNNPSTFYVGTGESQTALITYRESSGRGVGIWKTINGGQSFSLLASTADFAYITKLIVRNENGNSVVYAGVVSGTYKGSIWQSQPSDGLFRSADGGASWQQVLPDITNESVPYAPADVQLGADGRIFVGTVANIEGKGGGTILFSDLGTPGSWTEYTDIRTIIENDPLNSQPYRVVLAPAPSSQNIIYAAISSGTLSPTTNPVYKGYYLVKSSDKGVTWQQINTPDGGGDWANLAWHAMDLAVDPNDPATVYAGGLDMWRTRNSGSSWELLSDWSLMYYGGGDNYLHADQHVIAYKPGSSSEMLFGTDGGVFYSNNGNAVKPVFSQKNKNFNTLQFYTCAMHPGAGTEKYLGDYRIMALYCIRNLSQ